MPDSRDWRRVPLMQMECVPGQRWVSHTEPELGLGVLIEAEYGKATIVFPAADETRIYALESAPIQRVKFQKGDEMLCQNGETVTVKSLREEEGIITYICEEREVPEDELSDSISFSKPEERMIGGQVDALRTFDLRVESLFRSSAIRKSPLRGLLGGRIDLIPHQIAIVNEVASRLAPRVLLADEVGLGKTIEACLILHRLHLTGRAERVLILVPEPLIHQWFVELYRRFNILFKLFDEARCQSITQHDPEANPFLEDQLVLCSPDFLLENPHRIPQVLEAGWDLLIVDEAHHLEWTREEVSEGYDLVQGLAAQTASVLLLTATPQQLGAEGHFARLQLLDPDRYSDLDVFLQESERYEAVAEVVDVLAEGGIPDAKHISAFADQSPRIREGFERLSKAGEKDQEAEIESLLKDLLDSFGTGRVMFRNTRKQLSGFPERKAHLVELEGDELEAKIEWLVEFLQQHPEEKVLLICKTLDLVEDIAGALLDKVNVKIAQFHEELTLIQRDRNAAFFAEEEGARVLLCSEIGSEGRNFQFAHHLVLYDLPENPELLEQRIGRLDRIGQTETIHIHVPFISGAREERYARWYMEGLNAFEKNLQGAQILVKRLQQLKTDTLAEFIEASKKLRAETEAEMERGHDRLLSLTSQVDEKIDEVVAGIQKQDRDEAFEEWVTRLFDHFGLHVEDLGDRDYVLHPGNVITDAFPDLPEEGMGVTFERERALVREEKGFMSADHPMVVSAIDLMLSNEAGNSAFGVWVSPGDKNVLLEAYFVVECVAPPALQADYFLPAVPVRVAVDFKGTDFTQDKNLIYAKLRGGKHRKLLDQAQVTQKLIPEMLKQLTSLAGKKRDTIVKKSLLTMNAHLDQEIGRLQDLAQVNSYIGESEISALQDRKEVLESVLTQARVRLDALRLSYKSPE